MPVFYALNVDNSAKYFIIKIRLMKREVVQCAI